MTDDVMTEGRLEERNGPLLDAIDAGLSLWGHVLVRSDGRIVDVADAVEEDWTDLLLQIREVMTGRPRLRLVDGDDAA